MVYQLVQAADIARVHADSEGQQYRSSIAPLADGGALVVFEQNLLPDSDDWNSRSVAVLAQRYDSEGGKVGSLVTIESEEGVPSDPYHPFAAGLVGGGYVIGWNDRATDQLRVQTFDSDDMLLNDTILHLPPRDLEGRGSVTPNANDRDATVTGLDDGGFSVSWNASYSGILAQYIGAATVFTQTFDADGVARSAPIQIMPWVGTGSYSQDRQNYVSDSVALEDGRYIVVLRGGEDAPGNMSEHTAILGRFFDSDGKALSGSFMINQNLETWADLASVDVLSDGDVVVAWRSGENSAWRRFDAEGTPVTDEMPLTRQYRDVEVTAMPDGGFLIGARFVSSGSVGYTTYAYRFDAENTLVDDQFVFTSRQSPDADTNYYAFAPDFAVLGNGQLLGLVEGHASWNGNDWEVFAWRQLAEELGSTGNDTLTANDDGMALFGLGGDDSLQGSAAADFLDGGMGDDTLNGGAANDTLLAGEGNDLMQGGPGDDTFYTGPGDNTIEGGAGTDRVIFDGVRASHVTVRGPADNLVITYEGSRTEVTGVEHFEFRLGSFTDDLTLAEVLPLRNSTITGTDDNDTLIGDYGDDLIYGLDGNDLIEGGAGNDRLLGHNGDDTLKGGPGNDMLEGGSGDDLLLGGPGDDTLYGGNGNDTMDGGAGFDQADLRIYTGQVRSVTGPDDALVIESYRGNDVYRNIEEFRFTDTTLTLEEVQALRNLDLTGTSGDDTLTGGYGDDTLIGAAGSDTLIGGPGSDALDGGAGNDFLFGDGIEAWHFPDVAAQVYRLYQAVLDRDPDATGHLSWTNRIAVEGMDPLQVTRGFVNSPEFQARFAGLDSEGFVTLLYDNVLGRAPDAQGLARWTNDLDSGVERAAVVRGFSDSPEFRADTAADATAYARANAPSQWVDDVFRLYQATLDRAPDVTGYLNWSDRLGSGTEFLDVVDGFVRSPEFQARFGGQDDAGFVTLLYNNVLERGPDEAGLARWTDDLAQGSTRAEVVRGFSQSPEFRAKTAPDHVAWVRAQDTDDVLIGGPGNDVLAGGRLSDTFVFAPDGGSAHVLDLEVWDNIDLTGFGYANDAEARAQMSQQGEDVLFADFGMEVLFRGTALTDITDDMILV